jgi:hypothetical protein
MLDYLHANGFNNAFNALKEETGLNPDTNAQYTGLLEKKWTSVIRLQKKVNWINQISLYESNQSKVDSINIGKPAIAPRSREAKPGITGRSSYVTGPTVFSSSRLVTAGAC